MLVFQTTAFSRVEIDIFNTNGSTPLVLAKRRGVNKDAIRLLEGLEEQEVKGFNRGAHSKLETMQMADSESAMESHSLLNPNLHSSEGVLSSFRTTWQEFVEDLGFWRVLLLYKDISSSSEITVICSPPLHHGLKRVLPAANHGARFSDRLIRSGPVAGSDAALPADRSKNKISNILLHTKKDLSFTTVDVNSFGR
ncbi:ankyrin repeat domain-containing protein 46-like [Xenentodon cancila]